MIPPAEPTSSEGPAAGGSYSIGDLAREFDLTTRAIRFYEDCGLITPQRAGRNRVYSPRDRARLKLTLRGKRLGLTLAEVKELLDMYESPRDTEPQLRKYLQVLGEHRQQLELQAADLQATLDEVRAHESEALRLLAEVVGDP
jgi:DNA-binding transcriptional MerR regulator